jgi:ATP-binding cassette subfamily F protein uup
MAGRLARLGQRPDPADQRLAKCFQLRDLRLLRSHYVVQLGKQVLLVCQFAFEINQSVVVHEIPVDPATVAQYGCGRISSIPITCIDGVSFRLCTTAPDPENACMSLIRFEGVSLDFADQTILNEADFSIEPGERVCLIGRNGAGKSTTLKLITGELQEDRGEIVRKSGLVISQLEQSLPEALDRPVHEIVRGGLTGIQVLLDEYRAKSQQQLDKNGLRKLEALHRQIDAHGGWHIEQRVETTISELNLPAEKNMNALSGGWRRRVALARALVQKPDLLLLDEPTNHLDIVTIRWLESIVYSYDGAVMFITHDRAFLQRLATRILEIDRGKLSSWPGDYRNFLRRKEAALEAESREHVKFDKKLEQEEIWIRQGIKARRTRNEGRARALQKMRDERARRQGRGSSARIHIEEADQSGRKVIRAKNVSYRFGSEPLIENFSLKIVRGDRIGILGNNGVGKTTLLRLLLGQIEPQSGTIKHGTNLEFGYFDQLREALDPEKSVVENVGDGRTYVTLHGKERHVIGYLKGFLFSPKRSMMPVKSLSGGERNRIILAKLFTRAANVLILDEPTNDLDMETLEVLEQRLAEYSGTLIVVSHDREFLDNVVTSTIVFEEGGQLREYVGGYSDWVQQGRALAEVDNPAVSRISAPKSATRNADQLVRKLTYNEKRELDSLPQVIEKLEARIAEIEQQISASDFYAQDHAVTQAVLEEHSGARTALDGAVERWTELEDRLLKYRQRQT